MGSEAFKKKGYKVWAKDYRSKAFKERSFQDNKKKAFETLILLYGLPSDLQTLPVPKGQGEQSFKGSLYINRFQILPPFAGGDAPYFFGA